MLTCGLRLTLVGLLENIGWITREEATRRRDAIARDIAFGGAKRKGEPLDNFGESDEPIDLLDDPLWREVLSEVGDISAPAGGLVSKFWAADPANTADAANVANLVSGPLVNSNYDWVLKPFFRTMLN